ncbi:hypothetical protein P280DRAFT_10498 [Massarina eburnea CBS 473.64]|uniref:Uncharacterized protein n=1 Tax=Massarina eburnea CBS 473.64 TaxID=1395130 RepID=A0A6A6SFT6_9PLEO|nr:hypothetical protein P280DRAFT_10498 [Massarina eburnea CBS 473.64]
MEPSPDSAAPEIHNEPASLQPGGTSQALDNDSVSATNIRAEDAAEPENVPRSPENTDTQAADSNVPAVDDAGENNTTMDNSRSQGPPVLATEPRNDGDESTGSATPASQPDIIDAGSTRTNTNSDTSNNEDPVEEQSTPATAATQLEDRPAPHTMQDSAAEPDNTEAQNPATGNTDANAVANDVASDSQVGEGSADNSQNAAPAASNAGRKRIRIGKKIVWVDR